MFLKPEGNFLNNNNVVVPTGFEPVFRPCRESYYTYDDPVSSAE